MIIGSDAPALTDWAVGFQAMQTERPRPRIAVHHGVTLFRIGEVTLKGFSESTEVFVARQRREESG